jgi:hypothetical protein
MAENNQTPASVWVGRVLSALVVLALLIDASVQLFAPQKVYALMEETGFPTSLAFQLGVILLTCVVLYAIPQTAVLGAILLTGFLGGAICTHFRIGEVGSPPQLICLALGVMAWGGLYFRDGRIRNLLPLKT